MAEWEPSEAEKQQAKMRLVRLDAEGNPVDGSESSYRLVYYVKNIFMDRIATLDDEILKVIKAKQVSFEIPLKDLSPETIRLLRGESGDTDAADDSDSDPLDR